MSTSVSSGSRRETVAPTQVTDLGELADNLGLVLIGVALLQVAAVVVRAASSLSVGIGGVDAVLSAVGAAAGVAVAVGGPVGLAVAAFWRAPGLTERAVRLLGRGLVVVYLGTAIVLVVSAVFGVAPPLPGVMVPRTGSAVATLGVTALPALAALAGFYYTRRDAR